MSWGVVVGCGIFAATMLYGLYARFALPPSTIFRLVDWPSLPLIGVYLPYAILVFAAVGAVTAWLGAAGYMESATLRRADIAQFRIWGVWALPVVVCLLLFLLASGGWSGHIAAVDLNYMSLAGLIPHSDAAGYYGDVFQQLLTGQWGVAGSRRPLAEAFRELSVVAARYSYTSTLLIQVVLLAIALWIAARSVALWRGIWAGFAFVGFIFILERPFLATTMTEPLGMIWALFALTFFIEAMRQHSLPHSLVALAALTLALLTRMGSLFTIPLLILWVTWAFGETGRRYRTFALACSMVIVVILLNAVIASLYGSTRTTSGANFALTMCGLSLGSAWDGCFATYKAQLGEIADERAQVAFLLRQTLENAVHDPGVLIRRIFENMAKYAISQPRYFVTGFGGLEWWKRGAAALALLMVLPWLLFTWRNLMSPSERAFWVTLNASILLSAGLMFADDGWRALHATHAFQACLLACAFAGPGAVSLPFAVKRPRQWQSGAAIIGVAATLFLWVPHWARAQFIREMATHGPLGQLSANEQVVWNGRHITGFLVLPNHSERPISVPTLSVAEFSRLANAPLLETELAPFTNGLIENVPFALVLAPRLVEPFWYGMYVAPLQVLQDRSIWAWRLTTREWKTSGSPETLQVVTETEPLR